MCNVIIEFHVVKVYIQIYKLAPQRFPLESLLKFIHKNMLSPFLCERNFFEIGDIVSALNMH